jgi:hypothetical protein
MNPCARTKIFTAGLIVAALWTAPSQALAQELWRDTLDQAENLGTRITADTVAKTDGAASIKVETAWPTVINLAEITGLDIESAALVYEADVRSEGLKGTAFLEMWCHFPDGGQYFSRGLNSTTSGSSDWRRLTTKFFLQEGQKPNKVTLNLAVNGRGTVWIDKQRLAREPLP